MKWAICLQLLLFHAGSSRYKTRSRKFKERKIVIATNNMAVSYHKHAGNWQELSSLSKTALPAGRVTCTRAPPPAICRSENRSNFIFLDFPRASQEPKKDATLVRKPLFSNRARNRGPSAGIRALVGELLAPGAGSFSPLLLSKQISRFFCSFRPFLD